MSFYVFYLFVSLSGCFPPSLLAAVAPRVYLACHLLYSSSWFDISFVVCSLFLLFWLLRAGGSLVGFDIHSIGMIIIVFFPFSFCFMGFGLLYPWCTLGVFCS